MLRYERHSDFTINSRWYTNQKCMKPSIHYTDFKCLSISHSLWAYQSLWRSAWIMKNNVLIFFSSFVETAYKWYYIHHITHSNRSFMTSHLRCAIELWISVCLELRCFLIEMLMLLFFCIHDVHKVFDE